MKTLNVLWVCILLLALANTVSAVVNTDTVTATNWVRQTSSSDTNYFMGKVGIGTNNPSSQLHVVGDVDVEGAMTLIKQGDISMGSYTNGSDGSGTSPGVLPSGSQGTIPYFDGTNWTASPNMFPQRATLWHDEAIAVSGGGIANGSLVGHRYATYSYQNPPSSADVFSQAFCLKAGTYYLSVLSYTGPNYGMCTWSIDGVDIVTKQNLYSSSTASNAVQTTGGNMVTFGGTATADSQWSASYTPSKAVDQSTVSYWCSTGTAMPHWIKWDCGPGTNYAASYMWLMAFTNAIKAFSVQGSTNDSSWETLYSGTNAADDAWHSYGWYNTTPYRYYRMYVASSYGPAYAAIREIWFHERYFAIPTDGYHTLRGRVHGKDSSSSGYYLGLTKYWLKPVSDDSRQ